MKKLKNLFAGVLLLMSFSHLSYAADANTYVGFSVGNSLYDIDFNGCEHGADSEHSMSVGILIGRKLNTWLAVEGEYSELGNFRIYNDKHSIETSISVVGVSIIGSAGHIFAKTGGEYWRMANTFDGSPSNNSGFGLVYGAGLQFEVGGANVRFGYDVHADIDDPDINGKGGVSRLYAAVVINY